MIELEGIGKTYGDGDSATLVLQDVSLKVEEGDKLLREAPQMYVDAVEHITEDKDNAPVLQVVYDEWEAGLKDLEATFDSVVKPDQLG